MKHLKLFALVGVLAIGAIFLSGCTITDDSTTTETAVINTVASDTNINTTYNNDIVVDEIVTKSNCVADDCLKVDNLDYPVSELESEVLTALDKAIDDEYKARATYEAVIAEYGSVRPFSMIIRAEEQHISSLKAIYDKYGATIPADPYDVSALTVPVTITDSCQLGVEAEIANAALYSDELLPAVTDYEDITTIFTSLMNASDDKHLPAFDKCN
ncbi:MAG: ferritin-like domain-containing protein [Candidatus Kerfeldbacteria bacterium]|jgi:hypothetical protein